MNRVPSPGVYLDLHMKESKSMNNNVNTKKSLLSRLSTKTLWKMFDLSTASMTYINRMQIMRELKTVSDKQLRLDWKHMSEDMENMQCTVRVARGFMRYEALRRGISLTA